MDRLPLPKRFAVPAGKRIHAESKAAIVYFHAPKGVTFSLPTGDFR
jgi:hypothetical protein